MTSDGGKTITARGIVWNTTGSPSISSYTGITSESGTTGAYTSYLASLTANTTYHVKAYATNSKGTSYGSEVDFTTFPTNPTSPVATPSTVCRGVGTALTVSSAQGSVYWYTGSCGGTYVGSGNPLTVYPTENTTYYGRNYNGNVSAGCVTVTVTVNQPASVPATASVSVPAGVDGQTKANISWTASTGLATISYYWAIGTGAGVTYESGYTSRGGPITDISALAAGLSASTTYYLSVKATNSCGTSTYRTSSAFRTNHILTYTANANGTLSGTPTQTVAESSDGTPITAVPNTGYNFVNCSDGAVAKVRTDTNVHNSITVQANFAPNRLAFVTHPVTKQAGQVIPVSVRITDTYGVTMTDATAPITIEIQNNPSIGGAGTITGTITVNAVDGVATFSTLWINKTGNGYTLRASSPSPIVTVPVSSAFNIIPGDIYDFTVAGISSPVVAGVTTTPVVTAYDEWDNIKTDYTGKIHFTSTDVKGTTVLPADYTFLTANNGVKSFTNGVMLTTTGDQTVIVTGTVDTKTGSQTPIHVDPAAIDHFHLAANGTIKAGTAFTVTATAQDVYHNVKTDYDGPSHDGANNVLWTTTATSSPNGTGRFIPSNGNQTFSSGVSTISGFTFFNSDQAQLTPYASPTITIKDALTNSSGTTVGISVLNEVLDNFKVVAGTTQVAGGAFSTTVTARDVYWNTCIDYAGSIRFKTSNDALVTFPTGLQSFAPASTTLGVRIFTNGITINQIGAYWLRAADSQFAYKSGEQQNIIVHPGAFSPDIAKSTITVDSSDKIAGQEVKVTLSPKDAQGNLLYSCQTISVFLDGDVKSGTRQVTHGTGSGADGIYVFYVPVTITTVNNIISATYQDPVNSDIIPFDKTWDITVTPAPPSLANTLITPDAGSITTNGTQAITVQLYDKFNNKRTTNDGVVTLTTTLGSLVANNGSKTNTAVYDATGAGGKYTATLYASFEGNSGAETGVGTAAITGAIAFNATAGPGDYIAGVSPYEYVSAPWPSNGSIVDGASVAITEGLPNLITSTVTNDATVVGSQPTMTTDQTATITVQLKDYLGNLITHNRGAVTLTSNRGVITNIGYLSSGRYTATLTAGTTAVNGVGLATIYGTLDGDGNPSDVNGNFNNGAGTPVNTITTVNIIEGAPAVSTIDISTAVSSITADESTLVTVQLKDALGNLIVNDRGTVTLSDRKSVV